MSDRELMERVPDSYDEFVDDMVGWMGQDVGIRNAILEQLRDKPESDTSDVLEVLCKALGVGKPLKLIDDNDFYYVDGKAVVCEGNEEIA